MLTGIVAPTRQKILVIIAVNAMLRRYTPGIPDILYAGEKAKDVIEKCCVKSSEDELRAMLADAVGDEAGVGSLEELLSRMAT